MIDVRDPVHQVVAACIVILALVGMHQLVVATCHPVAGEPSQSILMNDPHETHSDPAPDSTVDIGSTCLAILVLTSLLVGGSTVLLRRMALRSWWRPVHVWLERVLPPPDLSVLSISRT